MPTKGSPIFHVRYPPERAERLEMEAARRDMTPSEFIRAVLDMALGFTNTTREFDSRLPR